MPDPNPIQALAQEHAAWLDLRESLKKYTAVTHINTAVVPEAITQKVRMRLVNQVEQAIEGVLVAMRQAAEKELRG